MSRSAARSISVTMSVALDLVDTDDRGPAQRLGQQVGRGPGRLLGQLGQLQVAAARSIGRARITRVGPAVLIGRRWHRPILAPCTVAEWPALLPAERHPERVLAVYAHPDDPEVSCAGTLARWADEGAEVHLVVCAVGDKGAPTTPTSTPSSWRRAGPTRPTAAAKVLGLAGHENLGHPDGEVDNTLELRAELVGRIRSLRPDVVVSCDPTAVFFGSRYVNHHDHRGRRLRRARRLHARPPPARSTSPRPGRPTRSATIYLSGTLQPDTWVDIAATLDRKVEALRCHRSQVGDDLDLVGEVVRRRAASAGADAGWAAEACHAEAFRVADDLWSACRARSAHAGALGWRAVAGRSGPVGRCWMVFHSPMARRASTTTTATPTAPIRAPTSAPSASGVAQAPWHCRSVKA